MNRGLSSGSPKRGLSPTFLAQIFEFTSRGRGLCFGRDRRTGNRSTRNRKEQASHQLPARPHPPVPLSQRLRGAALSPNSREESHKPRRPQKITEQLCGVLEGRPLEAAQRTSHCRCHRACQKPNGRAAWSPPLELRGQFGGRRPGSDLAPRSTRGALLIREDWIRMPGLIPEVSCPENPAGDPSSVLLQQFPVFLGGPHLPTLRYCQDPPTRIPTPEDRSHVFWAFYKIASLLCTPYPDLCLPIGIPQQSSLREDWRQRLTFHISPPLTP